MRRSVTFSVVEVTGARTGATTELVGAVTVEPTVPTSPPIPSRSGIGEALGIGLLTGLGSGEALALGSGDGSGVASLVAAGDGRASGATTLFTVEETVPVTGDTIAASPPPIAPTRLPSPSLVCVPGTDTVVVAGDDTELESTGVLAGGDGDGAGAPSVAPLDDGVTAGGTVLVSAGEAAGAGEETTPVTVPTTPVVVETIPATSPLVVEPRIPGEDDGAGAGALDGAAVAAG